jgi:cobalt-zinc-cadmium resistance protein CzcA
MDGILNITYFNARLLASRNAALSEAVFNAATEQRMRPMLMTAMSACIGLLPAAISSHGIGSQVQRPLATVVVGGMFIGPLLLLIVAPALRQIFLSRERVASPDETPAAAPPEAAH